MFSKKKAPVLLTLLRRDFRETWNGHNLAFLGLSLLLAAFLLSGLPIASGGISSIFRPVSLAVVDDDKSLISYTLIDQFSDLDAVDEIYVEDLASAQKRLQANEILLILVIPENFYEETVRGGERSSITVFLNERMPAESAVFTRLLGNTAGSVTAIQAAVFAFQDLVGPLFQDYQPYSDAVELAATHLAFRLVGRQSLLAVDDSGKFGTIYHVISALSCLLALLTGLIVLAKVQSERRLGLQARLVLAGVSWWQPMLARQLIGLLWLAAGFGPLLAALHRLYPDRPFWPIIGAVVLLYWSASLLSQILGLLAPPGETALLAAWLGLFLLLLAGGCFYPWQLLPDWLQKAGLLSPARWGYLLIYRSLARQEIPAMAYAVLGLTAILATGGTWLAWRRSRLVN
jgi:ABC-2 type transport system permease protein